MIGADFDEPGVRDLENSCLSIEELALRWLEVLNREISIYEPRAQVFYRKDGVEFSLFILNPKNKMPISLGGPLSAAGVIVVCKMVVLYLEEKYGKK